MSHHGRFFPKQLHKYAGNPNNIVFRSAWERTFMEYCDRHKDILSWASEELAINYYFPGDGKWHKYYPDFLLQVRTAVGPIQVWMVEVKPFKYTTPPKPPPTGKPKRRHLREMVEYHKNQAKWTAARSYCTNKDWRFVVLTEKDLYPPTPK